MNEDLKYTLNTINDWLKFAEAKNAGLLALNIASIFGLIGGSQYFTTGLKTFEGILIMMFCASSCLCLYSISPILNKGFRFYKKMDDSILNDSLHSLNALFYGDIAKLSCQQFISLFEYKHKLTLSNAERDFGNQITNNAEICVQKYSLFKIASWVSLGAFFMGIILVILNSLS